MRMLMSDRIERMKWLISRMERCVGVIDWFRYG
jgi:hypothetical protein